jgi:hypothetical protein
MKKVHTGNSGYLDVFEDDDGEMYLVVLCAGIAWTHVGIVMNSEERLAFLTDPSSVDELARRMCFDFTPFRNRAVPENLRPLLTG